MNTLSPAPSTFYHTDHKTIYPSSLESGTIAVGNDAPSQTSVLSGNANPSLLRNAFPSPYHTLISSSLQSCSVTKLQPGVLNYLAAQLAQSPGTVYARMALDSMTDQAHPDILPHSAGKVSSDVIWTQLRYQSIIMDEMKSDIHEAKASIATLILELAKMPSTYAQTPSISEHAKRIDSLESTRDLYTPTLQNIQSKQAQIEAQVQSLITYREQQSGGTRWVMVLLGLLFTFINIGISLAKFIVVPQ